ncbi:permease-like cell division protein FtsX [Patescibacteria group bacterium]|nr:permease-like cell division protein FtsX [Patescibacteria group bacterium]
MFTSLKRVLKFGWQGFLRNKGLSSQVIFIMTIAVLVITSLFIFKELSNFLIAEAQKKVDVSVYFKKDTSEESILEVKEGLYKFSAEIEDVQYTSREKAQEIFLQKHKDDPLYLEALEEVGENPFLASLNIRAKDPTFYAQISNFLTQGIFKNLIEKVSYYENKKIIDRLFALTSNIKTAGILLSLILGILVVLITFNTVKLTIFTSKDEIATMRLVGASNWFIRGPFLVQSFLYGIFAVLIADLIFFGGLSFLNSGLENWILGFNFLNYFQENFLFLILIQIGFAFALGTFSSLLAVRKYLKV